MDFSFDDNVYVMERKGKKPLRINNDARRRIKTRF